MKFKNLVLAGTFDHLHLGHQIFIKNSLQKTKTALLGLTTSWINKNKDYPFSLQSYKKRHYHLKIFLIKNNLFDKTKVFALNDPFGQSISNPEFEAIAATNDSLPGAKLVNKKRKIKGLKALPIVLTNLVKAKDKKRISSSRIRLGEIDRQGLVYKQLFPQKILYLPKRQRQYFKKPIGQLLSGPAFKLAWASLKALKNIQKSKPPLTITVGDITTHAFLLNNIPINLAVFDDRCQRKPINLKLTEKLKSQAGFFSLVKNHPGTISFQAVNSLKKALPKAFIKNKLAIIQVRGEEDLLVLPLILFSPLKTSIFYGQPNQGLVQVTVTEKVKSQALNLLKKLSPA